MAFRLVTGRGEVDHVSSDDMGVFYAYTTGDGRYRLNDMTCTVIDSNTLHVSAGNLLIDGRHFRNSSEGTNLTIANGAQGMNRIDMIVVRYQLVTAGEDYTEEGDLIVIQGESVAGEPVAPSYEDGSIIDNDTFVDIPLFTVRIEGLVVGTPSACLLDEYELPAKYGGTGVAAEMLFDVRSAVADATAAAAAANAAAERSAMLAEGAVTQDELAPIAAALAGVTGGYLVVGDTVFVPSAKGVAANDEITFYSASFNEDTGAVTLT